MGEPYGQQAPKRAPRVGLVFLLSALLPTAGRAASGGDDALAQAVAPASDGVPTRTVAPVVDRRRSAATTRPADAGRAGLDRSLQEGGAAFARGDWDAAASAYRRAAALSPRSLGAWLGLQRAEVWAGRWDAALSAGRQAIRLQPDGYTARARQAYARYMRGDYRHARRIYEALLRDWPDDAEIQLGLGFALARLGDLGGARKLRQAAATELPSDARLRALDALCEQASLRVYAELSATYQAFVGHAAVSEIRAVTASIGVDGPSGVGAWFGASLSETRFYAASDTYRQLVLIGGGRVRRGGFAAGIAGGGIAATDDAVRGTALAVAYARYVPGSWGGGLSAAWTRYPDAQAVQADPRIIWRPAWWLEVAAGPSVSWVRDDLYGDGDSALGWSARAGVTVRPSETVALWVSGFLGSERYRVEEGGLSVWSGPDRYRAGYRLGLSWTPIPAATLLAELDHRAGDEVFGVPDRFQRIGGTLGVRIGF